MYEQWTMRVPELRGAVEQMSGDGATTKGRYMRAALPEEAGAPQFHLERMPVLAAWDDGRRSEGRTQAVETRVGPGPGRTAMFRFKTIFGQARTVEAKVSALNRMTHLGMPDYRG